MITANPFSTAMFRQTTAALIPFSHVRKLCGCGKRITEREQNQYGKCCVCVRAAKAAQ